jgi:hypothetical protein
MEKKTIQINPEFLKFATRGGGKTQRKKPDQPPKPIKMKQPTNETNRTVRRRMMNHLRQQQEANYRKMATVDAKPDPALNKPTVAPKPIQAIEEFKSDFDKSLEYLESVAKKVTTAPNESKKALNRTSRFNTPANVYSAVDFDKASHNNIPIVPPSTNSKIFDVIKTGGGGEVQPVVNMGGGGAPIPAFQTCEQVSLELPEDFDGPAVHIHKPLERMMTFETPKYGCLKGGTLPTYRTWKNQTMRADHHASTSSSFNNTNTNANPNANQNKKAMDAAQRHAEMRAFFKKSEKMAEDKKKNERAVNKYLARKKQKRILKRTYRVGKSKVHPRVSVLVSNKTMRNKIQQLSSGMKNTPIEEVRRFLIKKGLIRVGSTCPNDVLRKMYESTNLLCGELQNHNADNLLYNYLNQAEL